jgi:hypothetical protein
MGTALISVFRHLFTHHYLWEFLCSIFNPVSSTMLEYSAVDTLPYKTSVYMLFIYYSINLAQLSAYF